MQPSEVACNIYLNVFLEGDRVLGWEGPVGAEVVHRDGVDPLTQQVLGHRVGKNVTLDQLEGSQIRAPSAYRWQQRYRIWHTALWYVWFLSPSHYHPFVIWIKSSIKRCVDIWWSPIEWPDQWNLQENTSFHIGSVNAKMKAGQKVTDSNIWSSKVCSHSALLLAICIHISNSWKIFFLFWFWVPSLTNQDLGICSTTRSCNNFRKHRNSNPGYQGEKPIFYLCPMPSP